MPLMADESCQVPKDVAHCAELGFDGINIKLVKCGGITPALDMMRQARELNLKLMVGCMTESSVGISAIAQLLPGLDYVDMDGAVLLAEDIASGVKLERGRCIYPQDVGGSGISRFAPRTGPGDPVPLSPPEIEAKRETSEPGQGEVQRRPAASSPGA